ncbi:ATP-binding protein [Streptomyces sp. NPDC002588]|uniref:ATP-binding protein n=1 Tax=Streptomyces sp. NPDC002588 TaxID=3154419 RepID=UPI0033201E4A
MNEDNHRACRTTGRTFPFSRPDCQPLRSCSQRCPDPGEDENEAIILRFSCTPASVPASRRHTRELMSSWQIIPPVTDTVVLVVSELVTNAVKHSGGRLLPYRDDQPRYFDLGMYLRTKHVRVEVHDDEDRLPVHVEAHEYAEGGRGMDIIRFCARRWGARGLCTGGKVVWCDVSLADSSHGASAP